LILSGKSVCPQTFVFLHGISYNKCAQLISAVTNNEKEFFDEELEAPVDIGVDVDVDVDIGFPNFDNPVRHLNSSGELPSFTSKSRILIFLKFLFESEHFSEPMMGLPESHRRVTLFSTKNSVFQFYGTGEFNGIFGDFPEWLEE
jgi:hypothetical protein